MTTKKHEQKTKQFNHMPKLSAEFINSPSKMSSSVSEAITKSMFPEMDLATLISELNSQISNVQSGNLENLEAMLVGQANALQTIFVSLTRRAAAQEYLKQYGVYMTLALKAQSQSRATIQALVELKYPKQVAFVKQANIAHGNQQVNNGDFPHSSRAPAHAHAEKNQIQQNKLLAGEQHGVTQMDKRATQNADRKNKAMATLEK